MKKKLVSVVITTKNEEKHIYNCLLSIRNQTYPQEKIEIIIVDNNSTDKTEEIAGKFTDKVFDKGPERSIQRNFAIEKAKGEYILFLDADMTLSQKVIGECVKKIQNSKFLPSRQTGKNQNLIGLYIPEVILGNSYWCKVRNFERSFYNASVIDCVRFFPKKIWRDVGGFDINLTGPEDWDFDKKVRIRGNVGIVRSPLYHDESDFDLKEYLKTKSYYSKSFDNYIKKWGKNDPDIKKQLGWCYRLIGVFTENGKWRKLLQNPFLTFGIITLRILVGLTYLSSKHGK